MSFSRCPDKDERPTFNQIEFCLNHPDDRILGTEKSSLHRTRSITFSNTLDEIEGIQISFQDLQKIYCKTE